MLKYVYKLGEMSFDLYLYSNPLNTVILVCVAWLGLAKFLGDTSFVLTLWISRFILTTIGAVAISIIVNSIKNGKH